MNPYFRFVTNTVQLVQDRPGERHRVPSLHVSIVVSINPINGIGALLTLSDVARNRRLPAQGRMPEDRQDQSRPKGALVATSDHLPHSQARAYPAAELELHLVFLRMYSWPL